MKHIFFFVLSSILVNTTYSMSSSTQAISSNDEVMTFEDQRTDLLKKIDILEKLRATVTTRAQEKLIEWNDSIQDKFPDMDFLYIGKDDLCVCFPELSKSDAVQDLYTYEGKVRSLIKNIEERNIADIMSKAYEDIPRLKRKEARKNAHEYNPYIIEFLQYRVKTLRGYVADYRLLSDYLVRFIDSIKKDAQ